MRKRISATDHHLMRRINQWLPPRWFRWYMLASTRAGDFWIYIPAVLLLDRFGGPAGWPTLRACLVSGLTSSAICRIMKRAINRRRPSEIAGHCWATLLPPDKFAFPSLHTTIAFAVAVPVSLAYPHVALPVLFVAFSIGASRIFLGMHYLSDVIVGLLLGAVLGAISFFVLGPGHW